MKKFLMIFLFFSACSTIDTDSFFNRAVGTYTLNSTGARFLKKVTGEDISSGTTIVFSGNSASGGRLEFESITTESPIAVIIELKKSYQGLFLLCVEGTYVAMGVGSSKWLSTTNTKSNPDDVLFEHLIPIATKDD